MAATRVLDVNLQTFVRQTVMPAVFIINRRSSHADWSTSRRAPVRTSIHLHHDNKTTQLSQAVAGAVHHRVQPAFAQSVVRLIRRQSLPQSHPCCWQKARVECLCWLPVNFLD